MDGGTLGLYAYINTQNLKKMRASDNSMEETKLKKLHFVFIHGAGGGSWCWYKIKCLMHNSGYTVTCIDLKGAGIDLSDPNKILSFDEYNKPLIDFLSTLPGHEQVVLVGHSAGGLSLTDASHKFPKKIALAVYVAATMLKHGFSTEQDVKDGVPDVSEFGDVYDFEYGLGPDQPPTSAIVKKELERKLIYNMSPPEDVTLASMLLRPAPLYAFQRAKFKEGTESVEKVPRVYIKTMYDRVLKPEQQDKMIEKWPPSNVYVIESDHSPNFSNPFVLCGILVNAYVSMGHTCT
ncbi:putative carboxylesterase [Helianthus annuus]|nr:putative carboxylesterase [Helianthus annuus]KAJ0564601.1 putative carboxylesterase [Helianthus annuus]KAJ0732643.1 putative carboxylesterase [Helianthus annuus]KAJ0906289.1 putative carboxylesterase [Helianthus annuus]